jgi:hypothetical protein
MKPVKMVVSLSIGHVNGLTMLEGLQKSLCIYKYESEDAKLHYAPGQPLYPPAQANDLMVLISDCCAVLGVKDADLIQLQKAGVIHVYQCILMEYNVKGNTCKSFTSVRRAMPLKELKHLLFLDATEKPNPLVDV